MARATCSLPVAGSSKPWMVKSPHSVGSVAPATNFTCTCNPPDVAPSRPDTCPGTATVTSTQRIGNQLQTCQRHKSRQHVVNHYSEAPVHISVQPADRPWFDNIEQTEQHEAHQHPLPSGRSHEHGDPVADKFIPDNSAMIMYAEVSGRAMTQPHSDQRRCHQQQQVGLPGYG